jgi:hypothetical protein
MQCPAWHPRLSRPAHYFHCTLHDALSCLLTLATADYFHFPVWDRWMRKAEWDVGGEPSRCHGHIWTVHGHQWESSYQQEQWPGTANAGRARDPEFGLG